MYDPYSLTDRALLKEIGQKVKQLRLGANMSQKTLAECSGQTEAPEGFDYWLIKLDGVTNKELGDPAHWGEVEYIHSLIAKAAGINMTECRLFRENGRAHFMTKRFDRTNCNSSLSVSKRR